jgi:spore germination protein KC
MTSIRFLTILMSLLTVMFILTGCGQRQINDLAIVTAVGIDPGDKPNHVRISVQIVRPADIRGQTGAPSGGTGEPIYSVKAEGRTIFEAIRNLGKFSSRRVYWAHNYVIVMNEQYARQGISDMVDFFSRNHELRMNTWVVVTPDTASEVISTITGLEVVPGEAMDKLFRYNRIVSQAPRTNLMRLQESFLSRTSQLILAKVSLIPRGISNKKPSEYGSIEQVELSGTAIFRDDKMIGWLSGEETRGLLFFVEDLQSGVMSIACGDGSDGRATFELNEFQHKAQPSWEDNRIHFNIRLEVNASLVESGCQTSIRDMQATWQKQLTEQLTQEVEHIIDLAQNKYKADFLKLGETFHNKYPYEWKTIQQQWDEQFSQADISVNTSVHLHTPMLIIKPMISGKQEESK